MVMSNTRIEFIISLYGKITLSELRLILKNKGTIDLWYDVYDDVVNGPSVIWNITKVGKEYKLTRYLSSAGLYNYNLVRNYTHKIINAQEEIPEEIVGQLKDVLKYINFLKSFKVIRELINIDNIKHNQLVGNSNTNDLPFDKYYKNMNKFSEDDPNKIFKWFEEDYFRVFKHALNYLGIEYKQDKYGITWWYLGQKFISKVKSFGQIGYGVCYSLTTQAIEKYKFDNFGNYTGPVTSIKRFHIRSSTNWLSSELLEYILAVNILKSGKVYNGVTKCEEFNGLTDLYTLLVNKKILHPGDPTYVVDSVFDGYNDKDQWIKGSRYLKSRFPDINKICKEAKNLLLELDPEIISKLKDVGVQNIILGFYGFREMFVHPNPYNHSSMICWRFNNPITLDTETGKVEYHHLQNNEKLPYPRMKIADKEVLVEAYQNALIDYCYRIPFGGVQIKI